MITLRQLEIFVQVVRAGSFRRCADVLGMSQVSVSEHIRALEQRFGTVLFDRRPGGVPTITDKGRLAHARVTEILALIADLQAEMEDGTHRGRQLNVSMHTFLVRHMQQIFADFSAANAPAEVRIQTALHTEDELLDMIADRGLDLAYFFALGPVPGTRLVRHEALAVFVGLDHPLAGAGVIDVDDLARVPAVLLTPRDPLRGLVDRAFAAIGLSERCVGIETDEFGLILGSVQRGAGYACLFEASAQNPERMLGITKLTLSRQLPALQVQCAVRPSATRDPLLLAFMQAVEGGWARFGDG